MAIFELLGSDSDETRLVRAPDIRYSLALAGHPRVIEGEPDEAKYDIRVALSDLRVEHGLRFSEMPDQMDPQALAISLATAYRNTRATAPTENVVQPLPDVGTVDAVIGGAHVLYPRKNVAPVQMEYLWVAIHRSANGYRVLYHTVRFRMDEVTTLGWGHLRSSFIDQHVYGDDHRATPTIWPASAMTRPSARLDLTDAGWADAREKAAEISEATNSLEEMPLFAEVALAFDSPRATVGEMLDRIRENLSTLKQSTVSRVLVRGLGQCRTFHDLRGWACQASWLLGPERTRAPVFRARLSYGNPHAPFGIGAYTVTVGADDRVELIHERGGKRRCWIARAEPILATTLAAGLASAKFPDPPSTRVGPPDAASFELEVPRGDGTIERASGFPSPNYRDVSFMFSHIVSQMSGDAVLGFTLPLETRYVSDTEEMS